jgi:hypothetical protein
MGANTAMWKVFAGYAEVPVSCANRFCLPKKNIAKDRKKIYFFILIHGVGLKIEGCR